MATGERAIALSQAFLVSIAHEVGRNWIPTFPRWSCGFPRSRSSMAASVSFAASGAPGVPVYTVVGRRCAPTALSRYVKGRILWQPDRGDSEELLIERLLDFGRRLGRRSLIICTGDEMALFAARHRDVLSECFILPEVDPELPATLVDKRGRIACAMNTGCRSREPTSSTREESNSRPS